MGTRHDSGNGLGDVYLATSADNGTTWAAPFRAAQRLDAAERGGSTAELVWQAVGGAYGWDVYKATEGTPWTVVRANPDPDPSPGWQPTAAYTGAADNVLWSGNLDGAWKIWGDNSGYPVSGANATQPDVATRNATELFVAYSMLSLDPQNPARQQYDIFWSWSNTAGATWVPIDQRLINGGTSAPSKAPSAVYELQDQKPWIVWREGLSPDWTIRGRYFLHN